jgi:hypothetical protein
MDLKERFEAKVAKGPNAGDCWLWIGAFRNDYGAIRVNGNVEYAHRASWCIYRGEIPEGMILMHSCDNTACVNPDHLSLGIHKENTADAINKGRLIPFRPRRSTPLSVDEISALKRDYFGGVSASECCRKYVIAPKTLQRLLLTPDRQDDPEAIHAYETDGSERFRARGPG